MKKAIVLVIGILACSFVSYSQTPNGKNPNKDNYLLSEPILEGCATIDSNLYANSIITPSIDEPLGGPYLCAYAGGILDMAQKFHTDTLLTLRGIAWVGSCISPYKAYIAIADTSMNIKRRVPLSNDDFGKYEWEKGNTYKEYFFDKNINVKGDFFVLSDMPKPYPYDTLLYRGGEPTKKFFTQFNLMYNCLSISEIYYHVIICTGSSLHATIKTDYGWQKLDTVTSSTFGYLTGGNKYEDKIILQDGNLKYANANASDTDVIAAIYWFPIFDETDSTLSVDTNDCIGCDSTDFPYVSDTITQDTVDSSALISIVDQFSVVYPNPTHKELNVQCSFKILDIELVSSSGQTVLSQDVNAYHTVIDVSDYAKGTYFLNIKTKSGTAKKKVLIQ